MKRTIAIHQPNYIPWLGYFFKIQQADYFVFLDDAQYSTSGMHNYHYLKTPKGPQRIKIPVKQSLGDKINEVGLKNDLDWDKKHLQLLKHNYQQADHFEEVFADFEALLREDYKYLSDLNVSIIKFLCEKLGIESEFLNSSELDIHSVREERIIDICQALEGEIYYSGTGARAYQNEENFLQKGIQVKYSEYKVFEYGQQFSGFQANVTVLDFLMNHGYRWDLVLEHQKTS